MRFAGTKIANFLGDKPNYDELGSQATLDSARGVANTALNNARAADATMRAQAEVLAAEHNADAIRAGGQAAATSSMASSIGGAIGGLAGSFGGGGSFSYAGGPGSTGTPMGAGGGSVGGVGTLGPNYGFSVL